MSTMPEIEIIAATKTLRQEPIAAESKKLRVAAYARVSTEQDEQQNSYEAQIDFYTHHIQSNPDWLFVSVFADRGITGTNTKNRDEFNKMIGLAMNGGIDLILTKSISRFARNTVDTLQTVRELKAVGVEVWFEKENLHTFDPKCEMMLTIMSSLAQEESRSISENVRWGQQQSMRKGKIHLAYSHFLGFKKGADGRPEIVEEEAAIVRNIYEWFLSGESINAIAARLTDMGIPTPSGKSRWSVSTIKSILSNEKYKGEALLQKTYTVDYLSKEVRKNTGEVPFIRVRNSHEPIIDPDVFDRVQDMLRRRTKYRRKLRTSHPFAGKIICGDCGEFYGHKVWHNQLNTERYDVWYCNHRYKRAKTCETPILRESEIKAAFESAMKQRGTEETSFSEERWRTLIEAAVAYPDRRMKFLFTDGNEIIVSL